MKLPRWRLRRRHCLHLDPVTGESWLVRAAGTQRCTGCGRVWS